MMATLSDTIERLTREGSSVHFGVVGNRLRAFESGETFEAHEVIVREYQRFEGVSNPDDMAIVYAIESLNGVRGSLVDAFGVTPRLRSPRSGGRKTSFRRPASSTGRGRSPSSPTVAPEPWATRKVALKCSPTRRPIACSASTSLDHAPATSSPKEPPRWSSGRAARTSRAPATPTQPWPRRCGRLRSPWTAGRCTSEA